MKFQGIYQVVDHRIGNIPCRAKIRTGLLRFQLNSEFMRIIWATSNRF